MDDIKKILSDLLSSQVPGFKEKEREFEIFECWERAAGPKVAGHCWPVKFVEKDTLLVASESSAWLQQLRYLEALLLDNLEREMGRRHVKKLRFMIGARPNR
ncbi:MAG: DUF721 domain-containing protein [Deltaproteobacteria bacterium]|nr:DUF721 domain-containing protein [Deltaproteobacteria bacterium]